MKELSPSSIDLVLTDPPYGVAYKTGMRKDRSHRFAREILNDRDLTVVEAAIPLLYRCLKDDSACFMFCSWKKQDEVAAMLSSQGFSIQNRIIWDKGQHTAGDLSHAFGYRYEVIIFAAKGKPEIRGRRWPDVWDVGRVSNDKLVHQNEKPVPLLERAILSMSDSGDVVLDPFMGSGSTAAACLALGRSFIGTELDSGYYKTAYDRLSADASQGRLFYDI